MKPCSKCLLTKPLNDFPKDVSRKITGYHSVCKDCKKIYNKAYRETNRQTLLIKMREYSSKHREELSEYQRNYRKNNKGKVALAERNRDIQKVRARTIVRTSVYRGSVTRKPCEVCGCAKSHAHHTDYNKPHEVRWLCHVHHLELHRL